MHNIGTIGGPSNILPSQGTSIDSLSNQSGSTFQLNLPVSTSGAPRGISSIISPSLGPQTVSALLQTQDLSETQVTGGGHGGGGGHHGGIKTLPSLQAEEAADSEEAQALRPRKHLIKTITSGTMSETTEVDENGMVLSDAEQTETNKEPNKK